MAESDNTKVLEDNQPEVPPPKKKSGCCAAGCIPVLAAGLVLSVTCMMTGMVLQYDTVLLEKMEQALKPVNGTLYIGDTALVFARATRSMIDALTMELVTHPDSAQMEIIGHATRVVVQLEDIGHVAYDTILSSREVMARIIRHVPVILKERQYDGEERARAATLALTEHLQHVQMVLGDLRDRVQHVAMMVHELQEIELAQVAPPGVDVWQRGNILKLKIPFANIMASGECESIQIAHRHMQQIQEFAVICTQLATNITAFNATLEEIRDFISDAWIAFTILIRNNDKTVLVNHILDAYLGLVARYDRVLSEWYVRPQATTALLVPHQYETTQRSP